MVPEEWPIAASAADRPVDPARARGPGRLATVRRDFFLDPGERLTEQERALMTAMLHDLVGTVANELRAAAGGRSAEPQPADLAKALSASGLLDRRGLIVALLRRADEHRLASAFAGHAGPRRLPLLPRMVSDDDPTVAEAAMALVLARGRRRDGFGQPRVELSDLNIVDRAPLVHAIAAAMSASSATDHAFAQAATKVADAVRPEESLDQAVAALADALEKAGRSPDELVEQAASEGEVALAAHLIARRAAIGWRAAWDHLVNGGEHGLALIARMAGFDRPHAARLIADLGAALGTIDVEAAIVGYDRLDDKEVAERLAYWRLPRDYRAARAAIGGRNG